MKPSPEAVAAARVYLRGLKPAVLAPPPWSLEDTARAIQEEGLCGEYLNAESRYQRKRRAYKEAKARKAAQNRRSEGV